MDDFWWMSIVGEELIPNILLWEALQLLSFKNLLVDTFGARRYESLLALSLTLLPLNTSDWVLDIRPSGHNIYTHHTHTTHILPGLREMASSHITHEEQKWKKKNLPSTIRNKYAVYIATQNQSTKSNLTKNLRIFSLLCFQKCTSIYL